LAKSAKENGSMIVYEPSAKTDSTHWHAVFPLLDVIKYSADRFNEREFAGVMPLALTDSLWEIQTLGASGLKFRKHEGHKTRDWTLSPAIAAPRVVDTCGAGDWCSAGLLQGLINSKFLTSDAQFAESIRLGQAFAAWACAFVGARGAMYCHDADSSWRSVRDLLEGKSVDVANMAPGVPPTGGQAIGKASPFFANLCSERPDSKDP
jgi:sugar/nucleoside kinase (ribokinase family)